jgi:pimeloyl-ACP methyl ester carboxylesterase
MKPYKNIVLRLLVSVTAIIILFGTAYGDLECTQGGPQGENGELGEYCIVMPPPEIPFNGRLVIWAHGFQDAGTDIGIPLDQLCFDGICIPDLVASMGFAFATNSYRRTGLAVREGAADILDLVEIFISYAGTPDQIYLVGASEGGLITTLLAESYPDVFDAGYALCGPIGDFPYQINYFGDARVTFEYFFPNQIPGYGIFNSDYTPIAPDEWNDYFQNVITHLLLDNPSKALQWIKVAKLPYDASDQKNTMLNSSKDVLRYAILNLQDAIQQLGGIPFDNSWKWYKGSANDFKLNWRVKRFRANAAALNEMKNYYNTSGYLEIPLITMHTTKDQQVPYVHEFLYNLKTLANGSLIADHINIPIDRYGHCEFTVEEALAGFAIMLLYNGDLQLLSGVGSILQGNQLESFSSIADQQSIPYEIDGPQLNAVLK